MAEFSPFQASQEHSRPGPPPNVFDSRELLEDLNRLEEGIPEKANEKARVLGQEFDLRNIMQMLKQVVKWRDLAMYLGVPKHVADCIEEDHKGDIKRQKEEAIDWWLNNIESASWQTLADALWKPDHCNLARTIESMMSEIPEELSQEAEFVCELLAKDVSAASTTVALPPQASGSANTGVTEVIVREKDANFLTEFLSTYSYKWEMIGTALNFLDGELKAIPMNNPRGSVLQFLKELLNQWIQWPTDDHQEEPTLDKLCAALRGRLVRLGAVANKLHAKRTSLPSQCQP